MPISIASTIAAHARPESQRQLQVLAALFVLLGGPFPAVAQNVYVPVNVTTPDPESFVTVQATACDIPNGGYVNVETPLYLDAHATDTGVCQYWHNGVHMSQYDVQHSVVIVGGTYTTPTPATFGNTYSIPSPKPHDFDSRDPQGGTGSYERTPSILGQYLFQIRSEHAVTACGLQRYSNYVDHRINVLSCAPLFNIDPDYPTLINRLQPTNIDVYLPSTMSDLAGPLANALADWNTALSGTGLHFNDATSTSCGSGATCVSLAEASIGSDCAQNQPNFNTSTGYFSSNITITLNSSTWHSAGPTRAQRTVAHELGHFLGLDDKISGCAGTDSVMREGVYACDSTDTVPDAPTTNDTLPSKSTAYGNGTKTACGF